jgi:GntR family transcriptional regulator
VQRLQLNPTLGIPIYRQVMDQIREQIAARKLRPGDQLPSIRELSTELRINPTSAVKAYNELRHLGLIVQDQGRGTFVGATPNVAEKDRNELLRREADVYVARAINWGFSSAEVKSAVDRALARHGRGRKHEE